MAKTTYLGANVEVATDSFGGWINKTNQLIYDMGTVVLTAGPAAQPNTTNGTAVVGNSHVEGIFSANTLTAVDELRGGSVSTPANLVMTTNAVFQDSALVDIQANTELFNVDANNVVISSNVTLDGGSAKNYSATLGDITYTSTLYDITSTTFNVTGTSTFDGPILNVDTTDLDVTANTLVTAATLTANVTTLDVDYTTATLDGTTFTHNTQDIVVNTNTATVNATSIDITSASAEATLTDLSIIANTATANVEFVDLNSTTIAIAGNTTITGTTATINAITTVNGTTVDVNANTTITGSNVDIVGHTTVTGSTVVTGTLFDVNANTTIDGSTIDLTGNTTITGTNTDIVGSASVTGSLFDINSDVTTIDGTLFAVNANTTVTGSTIGLNGDTTVSGTNAVINANTTINASSVNVTGTTTITGSVIANGTDFDVAANTTVTGSTLEIAANTTITGSNTDITGSASVTGLLFDVNANNTTIDGTTFVVNANTSVTGSTVDINGTTTVTGPSLTVGSNTTFNGATVDINSATDITGATSIIGDVTAVGNVSITSTNTVISATNTNITGTGSSITTNTLNVSANTTHSGRVTLNGNAKFAGLYANVATTDLIVGANSTFTASSFTASVDTFTIGVNAADSLIVNSDATLNNTLTVTGDQINESDIVIQGDLTVLGNTSFSSNATLSFAESDVQVFTVSDTFEMAPGATIISDLLPDTTLTYDIGSAAAEWNDIYANNFIGTLDWTNVANKPDPTVSVALTGDVVGSSSATLTDLANGSISILTTIQPNSIVLGTDTTGGYVQNLTQGTGVTITNNSGEGATPTIAIGQSVATTDDVTFNSVTVSEDVVVSGNLLVEGTTTTINTNEVNIGDNILLLNSDETGTPSQNAGFEIERGISTNVSFLWDETSDRWTLGSQSLVASSFIGSLTGNASTASKLLFGRNITLGGDLSGSVTFDGSTNVTLNATINSESVVLGTDTSGNYVETVTGGSGIDVSGGGVGATATVSHADTSSQLSVNNSNGTVIQDVTLDGFGHVTGLASTNLDSRFMRLSTNQTVNGLKTFANTTILQSTTAGHPAAKILHNIEETNIPALIVASDGESTDVIAEFRANVTGTAVDTANTSNSSDAKFRIFGTGNVNASGTITAGGLTTTGTVSAGTLSGDIDYNDITNPPTIGNGVITIEAGSGLATGGSFTTNQTFAETITLAHADTSSISNTSTSGKNVISGLVYDAFGHVTSASTRALDFYTTTESDSRYINATGDTVTGNLTVQGLVQVGQNGGGDSVINFYDDNSNVYRTLMWDDSANDWSVEDNSGVQRTLFHSGNLPQPNNPTITLSAGSGLGGGGAITLNQSSNETVTFTHSDTSTLSGSYGGSNNGVVIEDITVDGFGHITSIGTRDLDTRYYTESESDSRFVNITGDTMTGDLSAPNFNSTSDARIKENVTHIDSALSKTLALRGVYYNRIGEVEKQLGVIAQEVENVVPEVVHTNEDDLKTVSYGNLVGLLIEAVKELKSEIDDLKKQ